jgi:hypothetical protein
MIRQYFNRRRCRKQGTHMRDVIPTPTGARCMWCGFR